jgi:hypothetical protein
MTSKLYSRNNNYHAAIHLETWGLLSRYIKAISLTKNTNMLTNK